MSMVGNRYLVILKLQLIGFKVEIWIRIAQSRNKEVGKCLHIILSLWIVTLESNWFFRFYIWIEKMRSLWLGLNIFQSLLQRSYWCILRSKLGGKNALCLIERASVLRKTH